MLLPKDPLQLHFAFVYNDAVIDCDVVVTVSSFIKMTPRLPVVC